MKFTYSNHEWVDITLYDGMPTIQTKFAKAPIEVTLTKDEIKDLIYSKSSDELKRKLEQIDNSLAYYSK